jgi:hypothetical protein
MVLIAALSTFGGLRVSKAHEEARIYPADLGLPD